MEKLIHFLLENVFLVILLPFILGWLNRVRQQFKGQGEANSRPQNRMPSFGGDRPAAFPRHAAGKRPEQEGRHAAEPIQQMGGRTEESFRQPVQQPRSPIHRSGIGSGLTVPGDLTAQHEPPHSASEEEAWLQAKDAVNGVIWAEVLGPPRSRKPHRKW